MERIWSGVGKGAVELHHAYLLVGERRSVLDELFSFLRKGLNFGTEGNPDFFLAQFDTLTIDDSRRIKEAQEKRSFGKRKILVLAFNAATGEAQNAFLKMLEEPSPGTHFFLIVPRESFLLPTILSRIEVVHENSSVSQESVDIAERFLAGSRSQRLALAKKIAEDVSENDLSKQVVLDAAGHLERLLWQRRAKENIPAEVFEDIALVRGYASDRSASLKMLLEHLALVLPSTKL